ncbi:MAG TPA: PadR family transcriptional regulator [Acidothermaceae bacterium]|jgi:DNA-binding PadR family transcriptional regulator|nr:PadR family transcriptional regulator [Acidothermaceae bacterium]
MSATRLLVLGVIRILQPVHGYDVRRELVSWRIEELSNVKPGSIYSAIRTLERDGCIAVHDRASEDSRPERTTYVMTGEGEQEFQILLQQTWWNVTMATEPLAPALCLMPFMRRDELIAALKSRISQLQGTIISTAFIRDSIQDGATGADGQIPEHVREILDFVTGRTKAEIEWARSLQRRLREGAYHFAGEAGFPDLPHPAPRHPHEAVGELKAVPKLGGR